MIKAIWHVPNFVETNTRNECTVRDQAELLAVPWIARWQENPPHRWSHWALSDECLMACYDDGDYFWVVAYITEGLDELNLPKWVETPTARKRREDWNAGIVR